jgi:outer membrane protein OmpA-like peptidoglycan-associated protein
MRPRYVWPLVAVALAFGVWFIVSSNEASLTDDVEAALAEAGFDAASVASVDGRDVVIEGVDAEVDRATLEGLLLNIDGVRSVTFVDSDGTALGDGTGDAQAPGAVSSSSSTTAAPTSSAPTTTAAPTTSSSTTTAATTTTTVASTTTTTVAAQGLGPAPSEGAYVDATLDLDAGPVPGMFTLTGRVPDQETASALLQAAQLSYAPFVEANVTVDASLELTPAIAASPSLIGLLPSVTDGTMRVAEDRVLLDVRSPNPEYVAIFQGGIDALTGLPVELVDAEITDLVPPAFFTTVEGGNVTLSGTVPSEPIREIIVGGAVAAYGAGQVTDELTIDENTYTSFWMFTMPGIYQLFQPFSDYELQVVDGVSSGKLQGGVNFAFDSTELSAEATEVLNIGVAILARDLSLFMTVVGHTDSTGPDEYNLFLSEGRAASVVAYMSQAGVDPRRLFAVGAGESDPLESNDTEDGRAANRRVEFQFGPPPTS